MRPFHIAMCALASASPVEGAVRGFIEVERAARETRALLPRSIERGGRNIAALDRLARKNRRKRR